MENTYFTDDEAKAIATTIVEQIGWNARACIGAHRLIVHQHKGPGFVTLQIKTRNCAQRNRFVEVTYDHGNDLYDIEAVNITTYKDGRGAKQKVVWDCQGAFFDMLGDLVIEAADFKDKA